MFAAFWLGIGKVQSVNTEIQFLMEAVAKHTLLIKADTSAPHRTYTSQVTFGVLLFDNIRVDTVSISSKTSCWAFVCIA